MSHRTGAVGLALAAVVILSLSASAVGTVGAQTAGNDGPTAVLDAPETIERGQLERAVEGLRTALEEATA